MNCPFRNIFMFDAMIVKDEIVIFLYFLSFHKSLPILNFELYKTELCVCAKTARSSSTAMFPSARVDGSSRFDRWEEPPHINTIRSFYGSTMIARNNFPTFRRAIKMNLKRTLQSPNLHSDSDVVCVSTLRVLRSPHASVINNEIYPIIELVKNFWFHLWVSVAVSSSSAVIILTALSTRISKTTAYFSSLSTVYSNHFFFLIFL